MNFIILRKSLNKVLRYHLIFQQNMTTINQKTSTVVISINES